ncbi:MAG: pyruvate kinase [Candidatus Peribacteraceae bacterium]|nr:pyruvate kinase [Candidatus Peribacteraceae bacterium]
MRHTKIVCTIGPETCSLKALRELAAGGMNVARLNMSHGTHAWHREVMKNIRTLNEKGEYSVATMLDTKGPEVRSGDLKEPITLRKGAPFTFTIRTDTANASDCASIGYDGFIEDVSVDDVILVDGGLLSFQVMEKSATDVHCRCIDGGTLGSRRHINIRGKTATIPSMTEQDWQDIAFGMEENIDFYALSFVRDASTVTDLKKYLEEHDASGSVIAKIESIAAIDHLDEIIDASDGAMVARGDLGSEVAVEEVPLLQKRIVDLCRKQGKPVIVATHMLESMIEHPTPTRAEVTDVSYAIFQGTDAVMLSGETASGKYPLKALGVMDTIARRMEEELKVSKAPLAEKTNDPRHEITKSAAAIASNIGARAIVVFTRRGFMASLVSMNRPHTDIFAFTNMSGVRRRLNLTWGVTSFRIEFSKDPEKTIQRAFSLLTERELLKAGDRIIVVSDILAGEQLVETVQVRKI